MTVPGDSSLPTDPGWYPDPYDDNQKRWFDGTKWTLHAVAAWEWDPNQVVDRNWAASSPEELRRQEWDAQFPAKGTISYQTGQPTFDRKSGLFVNRPRPWQTAIALCFSLMVSGFLTIAAAVKAATTSQYWGIWAAIAAFFLMQTIAAAFGTIRAWPRPVQIIDEFAAASKRRRALRRRARRN